MYKKIVIVLISILFCLPSITFGMSYEEPLHNFKNKFHQIFGDFNLLDKNEASNLIESYVQKMESSLQIMKYYKSHDNNDIKCYFDSLFEYYQAKINNDMFSNDKSRDRYDNAKKFLTETIKKSKSLSGLDCLDEEGEYARTINFLHQIEKEYYIKLGMLSKIKLWFLENMERMLSKVIICSSH